MTQIPNSYTPSMYGDEEVAMMNKFQLQLDDARGYFKNVTRPRLDRWYKLYIAYTGDRQMQIKSWQANVFVPYIQAVVETLVPRIVDARPEFTALGRSDDDQNKAEKQQQLQDYFWEIAKMDAVTEDLVRSCLVYGTGYLQVSWKKDVREYKFLQSTDILKKKLEWKKEERVFYDAPFCETVDPYALWYDWHNTARASKQYWFKRLVLTAQEIERKYPGADPLRMAMAKQRPGGDLTDYASIRNTVKTTHESIVKGGSGQSWQTFYSSQNDKYTINNDQSLQMYEVFEWWRPFDDAYAVIVNDVPILKGGWMPIPYDFKESVFIEVPYLKVPNEFEGYGIPAVLENPQIMLNLIKNQRLDAATLAIHKMWIVNPMANVDKNQLVTRPFGIIYSMDPNGVREVQFSDIKASAYKEEELLKADMRYSSGVDDSSMGVGGSAGSATEVRHLRESTLERVRLFVNHLGDAYADVMRYWMSMQRQFFTKNMQIRVLGDSGEMQFPLIEKDDLEGQFDYRATVLPSIAGQAEVKKKQDMDLFQLLVSMPFVDPLKLTSKILAGGWNFSLDSIKKDEQDAPPEAGMPQEGAEAEGEGQMAPPGMEGAMPGPQAPGGPGLMDMEAMLGAGTSQPAPLDTGPLDPRALSGALELLRKPGGPSPGGISPFSAPTAYGEAAMPINLLGGSPPPTVKGIPQSASNPYVPAGRKPSGKSPAKKKDGKGGANSRGMNRKIGGKVNTNISTGGNANPTSSLMNRTFNVQN